MSDKTNKWLADMLIFNCWLLKEKSRVFFITVRNEVAKVMFLQACVCLSACLDTPPGADTPPGSDPLRSRHPPERRPLLRTVLGTHPIGMHSCCFLRSVYTERKWTRKQRRFQIGSSAIEFAVYIE